jgi:transcriptional regulator of aromatic amino acid metabolism
VTSQGWIGKMKVNEIIRDFKEIKEDYKFSDDIMCNEDERIHRIKEIINNKLSIVDKTLILLYTDCQSYRKLGQRLGLSHMTCREEIMRIKGIILKEYERR